MIADDAPYRGALRLRRRALLVAAGGAALFAISLFRDPGRALAGYLGGFAWSLSIVLGALAFLMIVHTMAATWPVAIRRPLEAIVGTLPLFALLIIPLLIGMKALYPWMRPEAADEHLRHLLAHKRPYLNGGFFVARAIVYLLVWNALGLLLRRWSLADDESPSPGWKLRSRLLSAGGLPPLGLTLTFAAFDWLMSLQPSWYSTMYGFYYFAGGALGGLALLVLAIVGVQREGHLVAVGSSHYYALGRLLLTFVIFWGYIAFFQFFLIWIADKPAETSYYLVRLRTSWRPETIALAIGQFAIPFLLLLPYEPKRNPRFLWRLSIFLLVMHYLDVHWLVAPSVHPSGFSFSTADLGGLALCGGLTAALFAHLLHGRPLLPRNDPQLARALAYESR